MNTIVDVTNLSKKKSNYEKVDVQNEIDKVPISRETGKEHWTKNAKILVYEPVKPQRSPVGVVMTMMRQESNKYYKKAEKTTARMMDNQGCSGLHKRAQMASFFFALDMMFIEVQNTMMHLAFIK